MSDRPLRKVFNNFAGIHTFLETEYPDSHAALPPIEEYQFYDWNYPQNSRFLFGKPMVDKLLYVGTANDGSAIYVYATGCSFAFNLGKDGVKHCELQTFQSATLTTPFLYLKFNDRRRINPRSPSELDSIQNDLDHYKFTTLLKFVFLGAGIVDEVQDSHQWRNDVRKACEWIKKSRVQTSPVTKENDQNTEVVNAEMSNNLADQSSDAAGSLQATSELLPFSVSQESAAVHDSEPPAKRTKFSDTFDRIELLTEQKNAEFEKLREELESIQQEDASIDELQVLIIEKDKRLEVLESRLAGQERDLQYAQSKLAVDEQRRAATEKTVNTLQNENKDLKDSARSLEHERSKEVERRKKAEARLEDFIRTQTRMLESYKSD